MHFPVSPTESPIFLTVQETEDWCVDIIEENAYRQGPVAIALIERYSGPVSVIDVVKGSRYGSEQWGGAMTGAT